jgi:hypothetical protein
MQDEPKGADDEPATAMQDLKDQGVVLMHVLHRHPTLLTIPHLVREITAGSNEFAECDAAERAVRDLTGVGLLHCPSRACGSFRRPRCGSSRSSAKGTAENGAGVSRESGSAPLVGAPGREGPALRGMPATMWRPGYPPGPPELRLENRRSVRSVSQHPDAFRPSGSSRSAHTGWVPIACARRQPKRRIGELTWRRSIRSIPIRRSIRRSIATSITTMTNAPMASGSCRSTGLVGREVACCARNARSSRRGRSAPSGGLPALR